MTETACIHVYGHAQGGHEVVQLPGGGTTAPLIHPDERQGPGSMALVTDRVGVAVGVGLLRTQYPRPPWGQ